ncbi:tail fiber protein [Leptolyngbya sp. FACHB-17]|uniref:tail fiber protein n=1 Tax=unclassified Leptolyngbya TaxID=2650499 RepID=UPI00167FE539|nr:tail fiber protein [Leptolyngbya sp. FACHB-17]MBD2080296.1 tail fiber protein [Leptolyngbya sp. FACHB-17]
MAADYRQYDPIEKRVRYFDGQFLKDQDFVDEQKYHLDRQRRPLRFLHSPGIVEGLTVDPGSQQSRDDVDRAIVRPGTAIDPKGQQIVLGSIKDLPLKEFRNQAIDVFIAYREVASDLAQEGGESNRRWHEDPAITVQKTDESPPENAIRLARLNLNGDGNVTHDGDQTVRQYAGIKLPTADGANLNLRSRGMAGRSWATLSGSLNVTDQVGIGTTSPNAKLEVKLASASTESSLKLEHIGSNLVVRPLSAGGNSSVVENTGGGALLINPSGANVGIGSNEATNRLHVSGTTGIRQNYLYLSGNAGGSSLSYNAHRNANNSNWVFPDRARTAVTLEMDDTGERPRFEVYATASTNTANWTQRLALDCSTGNFAIAHNGGTVGIGTGASTARLTVAATTEHLRLIRSRTETTGGKHLFLELFQEDPSVTVPEVFPAIRFHHGGRFWHRIEAQTNGIHFKNGNLNSDAYVRIFAENMIVTGMIVMWSGAANAIPAGWLLCNGQPYNNGQSRTPDLQDRFIVGAGLKYTTGDIGGANTVNLDIDQMPIHAHSLDFDSGGGGFESVTSHSMARSDQQVNVFANYQVQTNAAGGYRAHENRPPYYALCFIIKI